MTTTVEPASESAADRARWLAVTSLAAGTFILVTSEMLPVGLLTSIGSSLGVSDGTVRPDDDRARPGRRRRGARAGDHHPAAGPARHAAGADGPAGGSPTWRARWPRTIRSCWPPGC
ncbi:hypothetical protein ACFSTC_07710 [Nonomuraea ferruginea]